MYSIMVVEDSKPIVRDIISKIQSIRPDIKEIVVTYDGVSALDMLKKQKPDILLTDIKMPMMDGLELISKAKEIYPEMKCVVISGYGDFEFTHQALKLQVDEYILKPVDFEDFKRILQSLIYQIDQRRIVHQEEMFSNLLKGASEGEGMLGQSYMISVVRGKAILELTDLLTKKEIYQALEIQDPDGGILVAETKYRGEKVILYGEGRCSEFEVNLFNEKAYHFLKERHPQLNMMCSREFYTIKRLHEQYIHLSGNLSSLVLMNHSQIYFDSISYQRPSLTTLNSEAAIFSKKIESVIQNRMSGDIKTELGKILKTWEQNAYPIIFVRRFMLIMIEQLFGILNDNSQIRLEDSVSLANRILSECGDYKELESKLADLYDSFMSARADKPSSSMELAKKIQKYLVENLYGNITMQDISEKFSLSPSYVSRLMKMYFNNSPMDYYNKLKMQEAQKLLTTHNELRVKDIAEILGFNDQYYFSKMFKAQCGVSPAAFKKGD